MTLADVRDYLATLSIAVDDNCYMGKLDSKKDKSIGVYPLQTRGKQKIPLGGMQNASYGVKSVSILIHWTKSPRQTEMIAQKLYDTLSECSNQDVNNNMIKFVRHLVPEPQDVGTDDNGIYEYVIQSEVYYERKEG